MIPNNIRDFIKSEFSKRESMSTKKRVEEIINLVEKKFNKKISYFNIYDICVRTRDIKNKVKKIDDWVEKKKSYEVVDWAYIFHRWDELPFSFTVEEIDEMFLDFSEKWRNLTEEEMIQKYEISAEAWNLIKRRLRLYKKSNTISPYTAENISQEALDEKIEFATARHIDSIKWKLVKTHEKQFKTEAKKAFKTIGNIDYFLEHLQEFITNHKPIEIEYEIIRDITNNNRLDIAFSDIHIWKKNTDEILKRFSCILKYIIHRPETNINIICLWDLWESFAPNWMHEWQVEHMEKHWFELMMFIVQVFEDFLLALHKVGKNVTFKWIWWNHDRIWKTHNEDIQRTAALVIYELVKRGLSKTDIKFEYFIDKINTFILWNINYIIAHWDDWFDKRQQEDILWKNWKFWMYNLILHWDKHSSKLQETKNATMVQVPMLAGKWEYDTRLDLHSEPWFVVIEENNFKTADIFFKRLK